jgi:hypothetical protein
MRKRNAMILNRQTNLQPSNLQVIKRISLLQVSLYVTIIIAHNPHDQVGRAYLQQVNGYRSACDTIYSFRYPLRSFDEPEPTSALHKSIHIISIGVSARILTMCNNINLFQNTIRIFHMKVQQMNILDAYPRKLGLRPKEHPQ